jgi:hypothetical protein
MKILELVFIEMMSAFETEIFGVIERIRVHGKGGHRRRGEERDDFLQLRLLLHVLTHLLVQCLGNQIVCTGSVAHPASYSMDTGGQSGRGVKPTTHLHLVPKLRIRGAIPPTRCLQGLHKENFTFTAGCYYNSVPNVCFSKV